MEVKEYTDLFERISWLYTWAACGGAELMEEGYTFNGV